MTPDTQHERVAIILVNWKGFGVTNDCILSIKQSNYPYYEIIMVDNGSPDGSGKRISEAHPDIISILLPENTGFTGGNNAGLHYSLAHGFTYSMLLNNDTFVEPGFLGELVAHAKAHPEAGAFQSRIHFNHNRSLLWNGGSTYHTFTGFAHSIGENRAPGKEELELKNVDWITGCAFFVRNSVLREVGMLGENMFMYSEDVDLSFRIRRAGYGLLYVPSSIVYHIANTSIRTHAKGKEGYMNPQVHYYNQRNRIWIMKRYTPWYAVPTVVLVNFFYILIVICYFAARGRFSKVKAMKNAVSDGLSGKIRYQ